MKNKKKHKTTTLDNPSPLSSTTRKSTATAIVFCKSKWKAFVRALNSITFTVIFLEFAVRAAMLLIIKFVIRKNSDVGTRININNVWKYANPYAEFAQVPSLSVGVSLHTFSFGYPVIVLLTWFIVDAICHNKIRNHTCTVHHAVLNIWSYCMFYSLAYIGCIICISFGKYFISYPRPDFLGRCFPSEFSAQMDKNEFLKNSIIMNDNYKKEYKDLVEDLKSQPINISTIWAEYCERPVDVEAKYLGSKSWEKIKSGSTKTFPSGHAAYSACSAWAIMIFLLGKVRAFQLQHPDGNHSRFKDPNIEWLAKIFYAPIFGILIGIVGISISIWYGTTRVEDFRHFLRDVISGHFIGFISSVIFYHVYFPNLFHADCDKSKLELTFECLQKQKRNGDPESHALANVDDSRRHERTPLGSP